MIGKGVQLSNSSFDDTRWIHGEKPSKKFVEDFSFSKVTKVLQLEPLHRYFSVIYTTFTEHLFNRICPSGCFRTLLYNTFKTKLMPSFILVLLFKNSSEIVLRKPKEGLRLSCKPIFEISQRFVKLSSEYLVSWFSPDQ